MTELDPPPPPPPAEPNDLPLAVICGAFMLVFMLSTGSFAQLANLGFGLWFTELVIFFGIAWLGLRVTGRDPVRFTGLDSVTPAALGFGLLIGVVNYLAWAIPLSGAMHAIFPQSLIDLFDSSQVFAHQSRVGLTLIVLGVSLAAPLCEEFFFRGLLQRALMKHVNPARAIVITAFIFSAFHFDPVGFLARFELGVVFGLLAWRSGSIWPGIAAHVGNNAFASLLFLLADKTDPSEPRARSLVLLFLLANVTLVAVVRTASGRLQAPVPAANEPQAAMSVVAAVATFFGLHLSLGLLALDATGVKVRLMEATVMVPKAARTPELDALRDRALNGEVPLNEYLEARRAAAAKPAQPTKE